MCAGCSATTLVGGAGIAKPCRNRPELLPKAWLSLEREDNDRPARFLSYVIAAPPPKVVGTHPSHATSHNPPCVA